MPEIKKRLRMAVRKFGPFESTLVKLWEAFCAETRQEILLEAVPMELPPLHQAILSEGGLRNGDWDIAHLSTDWITEALSLGALEDLGPYIERRAPDDFPAGWPASLLEMQAREGKILGLPFHDGPECLIYRKDLFEDPDYRDQFFQKYGRPLEPPVTWDDFFEVAVFFQRPEKNLEGALLAAYPDGHNAVFDFCIQLWSRGGELTDDQGGISLDLDAAGEGLAFCRKLLGPGGIISPACHRYESVQAGQAFARGEAAMMLNWFGFAAFCEVDRDSLVTGRVDVAQLPHGTGAAPVSLNSYWLYAIGSGSRHKQVAYDFIRFAVSRAGDRLLTLEGGIGCRLSTWHDPEINGLVPYCHKLEALHRHARCLPALAEWPRIAGVIDSMMLQAIHTTMAIPAILDQGRRQMQKFTDHDTDSL